MAAGARPCSPELEVFHIPVSLWGLIKEHVPCVHEQQEMKRILGESLVDQSLELHEEVCTLMSIWEEIRVQPQQKKSPLPEPPHLRERLVQEICFFVENVCDKAKQQGLDAEKLLSRHNSGVIEYATETQRAGSSMSERPLSSLSTRSSPDIRQSAVCVDLQSMSDKFNYLQLDDVVQNIRCYLEDEIVNCLRDITILQNCLDKEIQQQSSHQHSVISLEPTLTELKEERAALEKELLAPESSLSVTPHIYKAVFDPKTSFRKTTAVVSRPNNPQIGGPNPSVPMKAVHDIVSVATPNSDEKKSYRSASEISLQDIAVVEKTPRRRTVSPNRVKVVSVGNIMSADQEASTCAFVPSPPPPRIVSQRPTSADRFRRRVFECREAS